jgi:hypothetical protein
MKKILLRGCEKNAYNFNIVKKYDDKWDVS